MSNSTLVLTIASVAVFFLALLVTALFHHKKSSSQRLSVIGAFGVVETELDPEGAVIVKGELWRARLNDGPSMPGKARIRVVGAKGHLLLVEPASEKF
jgi:membrane-bound serine protease (ClpP class)